ncbi:PREDICTED: annexin D5-like [Fragaria vesca subsp. vesca]|uniref:annexin D5-like n=1 Tax=Fragaria vesca subsp. vesca TaxID=101020 RepID=UPI0002C2EF1B|nr:PREDICTED: annexin D5-like [Fragaria vesca subsp. vesca]
MATLTTPQPPPSPRTDAIALHKAFKGFGCDTSSVISILAHRDSIQRAQIAREYRTMYSEDLSKRLSSELSGNTKNALLLWTPDPATRDATIVRHALTSSDLRAATEVICSRTPSQISQFKQLYHTMFNTQLERDVGMFTSGDLKNLLLGFVTTPRYEGLEFDRLAAENDAKSLYRAGEKRLGTDERKFIEIFTGRSRCHLNAVSSAYESMYGNSLRKAVKKETSGNFEHGLKTILECADHPGRYFARMLHKAMKGLGTDDSTLLRVVVTRAEIDMVYVKMEYQKKYGKSLSEAVKSETSGNFRAFLLALIGH